jgi:hypothetical protein
MRKRVLLLIVSSFCTLAFASDPPVWNRPTSNITVSSSAYFDCQTPSSFNGTAAYMKLWVGGNAVALNHNLNRLAAVVPMSSGAYSAVCQYSIDGVTGISGSTLTITYGDSALEYLDLQNSSWTQIAGCSGSCGGIGDATNTADSTASDTWDGSGTSREFVGTKDASPSFEDEDWYQKRFVNMTLPDAWIYDFWLRQSSLPRALEFGISHCDASYIKYRMAFQADYVTTPNPIWNVFSPTATDIKGSDGVWTATTLQPPNFTNPDTDPNHGFTHVFVVGHPSTDGSGNPTVVIDALQLGAASGTSPGNAAQIVNIAVAAYTEATNNCSSSSGQWNLQSAQLDLDTSHTSDAMWLDDVAFHFQP